jgi:hypothetical protein
MAYPDKGGMGLARRNPGGQLRLGLSATAGSAVLYSAIVLFGVGSASPSAPDVSGPDHRASVMLIPGRTDIVSGFVQKLPQASPEPGRTGSRVRPHRPGSTVGPTATAASPSNVESPRTPARPRVTESGSPSASGSSTAPVAVPVPTVPLPDEIVVTVPAVPAVPEVPVPLPELPKPPPLDLPG